VQHRQSEAYSDLPLKDQSVEVIRAKKPITPVSTVSIDDHKSTNTDTEIMEPRATNLEAPSPTTFPTPSSTHSQTLISTPTPKAIPVVIKLVCPYEPYRRGRTYPSDERLRHLRSEALLYEGALKPIQGSVVPRSYGLFMATTTTKCDKDPQEVQVFGLVLDRLWGMTDAIEETCQLSAEDK